jgi:hypothetical protein
MAALLASQQAAFCLGTSLPRRAVQNGSRVKCAAAGVAAIRAAMCGKDDSNIAYEADRGDEGLCRQQLHFDDLLPSLHCTTGPEMRMRAP